MKSSELRKKLLETPSEVIAGIGKSLPIGIEAVRQELINAVLIDKVYEDSSQEDILQYVFYAGYVTAVQEQKLILEEKIMGAGNERD